MDNKIKIGCFFLAIAAFLYSTKHITAAIMVTNMNNEKANYFEGGYQAVGFGITFWTFVALVTGLLFFVSGVMGWSLVPAKQKVERGAGAGTE